MRRIISVLTVAAIMTALIAAPAFASKGGIKPFTYGDCVSAVAAEGEQIPFVGPVSGPGEFTERTAPLQSRGQGNANEIRIGCVGFPPG